MSVITNLKTEDNILTFDLNNSDAYPVKIGLANSLRRVIISNLDTYCIDNNSVVFYESYDETSILNEHFLTDRLVLIPIVSDLEDVDYENIEISCRKENTEEHIMSVFVSDFICKNIVTDEVIDINRLCVYPDILFTKLITGGKLSFECKLRKNTSEHSGAEFSPVCACAYGFKSDMAKIEEMISQMDEKEKEVFMTLEYQRYYERTANGEPKVYQFSYESIGYYDSKKILMMALNILNDMMKDLKSEFQNISDSKVISYEVEKGDFYKFVIQNINETLGEPLQRYLASNPKIFYSGYIIEHPLKKSLSLKLKMNENNTLDNILKEIDETFILCSRILEKCIEDITNI